MIQIKEYHKILNVIKQVISDSNKTFIKRSEITQSSQSNLFLKNDSCKNSDYEEIRFKVVNKMFMIHDLTETKTNEPRKISFKRILSYNSYKLISNILNKDELCIIESKIYHLTDTKYIMILSDQTFLLLNNLMDNNSTASCVWLQDQGFEKTIIMAIKSLQSKQSLDSNSQLKNPINEISGNFSLDFENILLHLISIVTKQRQRDGDNETFYTFSIIKVYDVLLIVLLPRLYCDNKYVVNVWPLLPVSTLFDGTSFIKNLKIPSLPKQILTKLESLMENNLRSSQFSLRLQANDGITFPQMIESKVTLLQLYMAYFEEFMLEGKHYSFVSAIPESASYIKCTHCNIIYDSIFCFLRHYWFVGGKLLFRCHICNKRLRNITTLGNHYCEDHFNWKTFQFKEKMITESEENQRSGDKTVKRKFNDLFGEYIPKKKIELTQHRPTIQNLKPKTKRNYESAAIDIKYKKVKEFDENVSNNLSTQLQEIHHDHKTE